MTYQGSAAGDPSVESPDRARRMSILSRATHDELVSALASVPGLSNAEAVRGPETGLVMLRGRIGGGGNAFNLGEATVTRATVRLMSGAIGHGQRLGTEHEATRLSAIADALAEAGEHVDDVERLLQSVSHRLSAEAAGAREEAAATRVDFFTLVRGEDQ